MINSITDFLENGIQNLIQMSENFAKHPGLAAVPAKAAERR